MKNLLLILIILLGAGFVVFWLSDGVFQKNQNTNDLTLSPALNEKEKELKEVIKKDDWVYYDELENKTIGEKPVLNNVFSDTNQANDSISQVISSNNQIEKIDILNQLIVEKTKNKTQVQQNLENYIITCGVFTRLQDADLKRTQLASAGVLVEIRMNIAQYYELTGGPFDQGTAVSLLSRADSRGVGPCSLSTL